MSCPCKKCQERFENRTVNDETWGKLCVCQNCNRPFGPYPGMGAVGFQGRSVDHTYLEKDQGTYKEPVQLEVPVYLELCLTCYRKDQILTGEDPLFDRPYGALELDRLHELPDHEQVLIRRARLQGKPIPSPPPIDPRSFPPQKERRQIAEESNAVPASRVPNHLADLQFEIYV